MTFISAWESAQSQLTPLLLLCLDPKVQPMAKEKCLLDLRAISQDGKSQVVHVPGGEKKPPNNLNRTLQVGNEEEGFTSGRWEDVSSVGSHCGCEGSLLSPDIWRSAKV